MSVAAFKTSAKMRNLAIHHEIQQNVASVALSIEALESLLIEKGVLGADELMNRVKKLMQMKILGSGYGHMDGDDD